MTVNLVSILPPFLSSLSFIALGYFVYSRNKSSRIHLTFFLLCFTTFLWQFSWTWLFTKPSPEIASLIIKTGYTGIILLPVCYFHFIREFLNDSKQNPLLVLSYAFAGVFLIFLWCTPLMVSGYFEHSWGYYPKAGPAHPAYLLMLVVLAVRGVFLFKEEFKRSFIFERRNQIRYMTWALVLYLPASADFAINYGARFYPVGFLFITAFLAITGVGIVKHQLLDVEVIVKRATVFAGLFSFVYGTFVLITFLGQTYFGNLYGWNIWASIIPTLLIITFVMRPLEDFLMNITESYLFQKKYDYRALLRMFTSEVLTIVDLKQLADKTVQGLHNIIKLESCGAVFLNDDTGQYELLGNHSIPSDSRVYEADNRLIRRLRQCSAPFKKADLYLVRSEDRDIFERFKELNAEVLFPMHLRNKFLGFISLGRKKSGEDYDPSDLDVLMSLAGTEAVALSNAQLFRDLSRIQAEAAQREKMAVIGTLAAGINHEICNPLGIARGQSEMFLLNVRDGIYGSKTDKEIIQTAVTILHKVIKEIDRATDITKRLSSFAKPSKQFEMTEVVIANELDEILRMLGHELKIENIEIRNELPGHLPPILVDRKQFQEVMFNLVRNAAQAMSEQGTLIFKGRAENDKVIFTIQDTGSGIAPDKIGEIFNPFYTTKDPGQGTGLGLFIVKQIVERNLGTIRVESKAGKGTAFILTFQSPAGSKIHVNP